MRSQCRQQAILSTVAVVAWSVVLGLLGYQPDPTSPWRMVFFAALQVAGIATAVGVLPWMMRGYIQGQVLAYVAGYMAQREDDEPEEPRRLRSVR